MRAKPTPQAQTAEGAMTYHFGYVMLSEVANEKAATVCPEGNEGLSSASIGVIKLGYFHKGVGDRCCTSWRR